MTDDLTTVIAKVKELLPKVTPGPWRREALGGSSTVLSGTKPPNNDRRSASYGYRDKEYCLANAFLDEDDRPRMDFVEFSHADAAFIALLDPVNVSALLSSVEELERDLKAAEGVAILNSSRAAAVGEALAEAVKVIEALTAATQDFHENAMEYFSDTTFDENGVLANAEAKLSVTALPAARSFLQSLSKPGSRS